MSHRCTILYPADFFDLKKVDEDYEYEYREAVQFPEFQILFYNYDEFAAGGKLRFYPGDFEGACAFTGGGCCSRPHMRNCTGHWRAGG